MSHSRMSRLIPLFFLLAVVVSFFITPGAARAEGGEQIGNYDQLLYGGTFYVDILSTGEVINISLQSTFSSYEIYDPLGNLRQSGSGGQLGTGSQGSCPTLGAPITTADKFVTDQPGAWRVVVTGTGYCWDISVTPDEDTDPDPRVAAGRLWTLRYHFNTGTYAESAAIDDDFYAMTPGGLPDTNYVWQLDLNRFSGYDYYLNANDLGLNSPYSGYSHSTSGASVSDKFPLYLAYPAVADPRPETPPIASSLRFIDDEGVDVTISPGATSGTQDTGYFEFDADIDGTYALTIDTEQDGQFASGDKLLLGNAVRGLNRVQWDGSDPDGLVVPAGTYQAQLKLRGGEFHFIANDVETSGGTQDGLTIRQANPNGTFTDVRVYWDDATYLSGGSSTLPDGEWSNTSAGHHTWGTFSSGGVGDGAYLDTYVYGQTTAAIIDAVVASNDDVVHSPQMDLDADNSSGATGNDYETVWAADGSALAVAVADSDLTITDGDSTELTQAEVTLTTPQTGDYLTVDGALPAGVSIDGASTDTFLRLTGTASIADYTTALGQVRFNNDSGSPSNTQRTISLVLKDDLSNGNTVITTVFPDSDGDGVSDVDEGTGDSDGDGTPDYLDNDSDDDLILDEDEGNGDSDGDGLPDRVESDTNDQDQDGIPDYLDIDSDGDGIRDGTEGTTDTDGDGLPDYLDDDSDGDTIPDGVEGANDSDGDGLPDYKDTDSDDDGIPDSEEGTEDSENDGLDDREESNARDADSDGDKDFQDQDSDGDGIPDGVEGTYDTDGDGFADYIDADSDNDGIPDSEEGTADSDGDGIPDRLENNDADSDGDGTKNHLDADDDGDGLPTAVEGRGDVDNDGLPNYLDPDSDNDGIPDAEDGTDDVDGDGIPNFLDPDSDGDLIKDATEEGLDSDGDGIGDRLENNNADTDGDGVPNHLDPDDDNDGIPTSVEGDGDADGDGVPNYLDTDSDGDGIPDVIEGTADTDGDGVPNYLDTDSDGDGVMDRDEGSADSDGDGIPDRLEDNNADTDGDNTNNHLDPDDDGDGIPTADEGRLDTDGDGVPDYLDADSDDDGILDEVEGTADSDGDGVPDRLEDNDANTDGDEFNNYLDPDDDGDGVPTIEEGGPGVDSDGDGIPNYLDTDSDNDGTPDGEESAADSDGDGIPDSLEANNGDTDGDGTPDYLDSDDDGDGIPTADEGTTDGDGDGVLDYLDPDDDGDGIPTVYEGDGDPDGDNIPSYLDDDSDGDGVSDLVEGNLDTDGDGTPDYLDTDSDGDNISDAGEGDADADGDGVPDRLEANDVDSDGDGTNDHLDDDDDGDGIPTAVEGANDRDGDGIPNYLDEDSDGDGVSDEEEGTNDSDGDGVPDYLDTDSDNDGIPDSGESGDADGDGLPDRLESNVEDGDGDGVNDYLDEDSDDDGIPDGQEGTGDTDGDGTPDFLDDDDDGDGIPTIDEGTGDADGDGTPDYLDEDSDNDGVSDADEGNADTDGDGILDPYEDNHADDDNDGIPNYEDEDDDGDGILTIDEGTGDSDGDGTPDYLDTDSDDDGISDANEGDGDTDGDGTPDYLDEDSDNDGVSDTDEGDADSDGDGIPDRLEDNNADDDNDGTPNHEDDDDDGDGIPTADEGTGDTDGDGVPNYLDTDSDDDGILDEEEGTLDVDGDGLPDYLDEDSDGDGIPDADEGDADTDGDGIPDRQESNTGDSDDDGTPDYLDEDSDNDGIPDGEEGNTDSDGDGIPDRLEDNDADADGDGVPDNLDTDEDNDGIPNSVEGTGDTDGDGTPDYQDTDSDDDGIPDSEEGTGDADNDGIPDYKDTDSDNDGISDEDEGDADSDGDGIPDRLENNNQDTDGDDIPDYLDDDSDGDGIPDAEEEAGDADNDGIPDYLDTDSDNDGIPDGDEGHGDSDGDGIPDRLESNDGDADDDGTPDYLDEDSDNDGIADGEEGSADQDGDGVPNYLDLDSDGDGVPDADEGAVDDLFDVLEDSNDNELFVLANDSDYDGDPLTIVAIGVPDQGGVIVSHDTFISYTPAPDFTGVETFIYSVGDGKGNFDTATVTVNVGNVNDAPIAEDDAYTVDEDTTTALDVLDNDGDIDPADILTITNVGAPDEGGEATIDGDSISYTPATEFAGTETFTYTISDGEGGQDTATVTVTVIGHNDDPVAMDDAFTVSEDSAGNLLNVLSNDTDAEQDELTIVSTGDADNGGAVTHDGSAIAYTPAADFFGTETFTYTIGDGNGGEDTATVTVTVTNVNDDPVGGADSVAVDEDSADNQLDVLANDADVDANTLVITNVGDPDHGGEATTDGAVISYTPAADFFGEETFTYTVSDGNGGEDTVTVTVTVTNINDAPVANDDAYTVDEDGQRTFAVLVNDDDVDADGLTITAVGATDQGGEATTDGASITYTPAQDFNGTETFTYTVDDGNGGQDSATVTVTITAVNDDPGAVDDAFTVVEDSLSNKLDVLGNDTDVELDALTIVSTGDADNGGAVSHDGNEITYRPARNFFGAETFTYTIEDGNGGEDTATVTVTVTNVNDAPVAVDDVYTVDEDSVDNVLLPLENDRELDGEAITLQGWHHVPDNGTVTRQGDTLIYTPNANFYGTDTIYYTIGDGHADSFDTGEITVIVTSINDAPVAVDDAFTVDEDSANNNFQVLANDDDPVEGDPLSVSSVGATSHGGTATTDGDSISYTPAPDFFGTETFTYTISDGNGGQDTATVTVTVTNVPDDPAAAGDAFTVDEDSVDNALDVLANDVDVDGDSLSIVTVGATDQGGTATVDGDNISYTPAPDFFGTETFTYTVKDSTGAQDTVTVTVTVTNVNDTPVAASDAFSVDEDTVDNVLDVLTNDLDVDGDTLFISAVGTPDQDGVATIDGDNILYTPAGDFAGTETFTYTVGDGNGGEHTVTVTITVNNVNDAPVATADSFDVLEDTVDSALDVLGNDDDIDAGDTLSLDTVGAPDHGSARLEGGALLYTPPADFYGEDTFTYTVTDASGAGSTATVTVTVLNVNDAPTGGDDDFTVAEDSEDNVLDVLANDDDIDGDALAVGDVATPDSGGSAAANAEGDAIVYTPAADFFGTETFTYTVIDGEGGQHTATVTVTVTNVNDDPNGGDDAFTVDEDTVDNVLGVLGNDSDADGDALSIAGAGDPDRGGDVTIDGDSILYTPAPDFVGDETFTYTVEDGNGGQNTATVTVTVENVNDEPVAVDDTFTVDEDSTNTLAPVDNDEDVDGDTLSISAVGTPDQGGVATIDGATILYTPAQDFNGEETFTYTASDGQGGESTASITVNVTAVNDEPLAVDDAFTVDEDSANNALDVLDNDDDVDGDALVIISVGAPDQGGTATIDGGVISYTPAPDFSGQETFAYTMGDGGGAEITGTVTVTVDAINDAPQAADDGRTALQGEPLTISPLANDADVEGSALSIVSLGTPDQGGAVTLDGDTVIYTSQPDYVGQETFTYTVSDGDLSAEGLVTVTVVEAVDVEQVDVTVDTTLVYTDAGGNDTITATVRIPAGAMGNSQDSFALVYSEIAAPGDPPHTFKFAGFSFSLNAYVNEVLQEGFVFQTPISITLQYGDEDVALLDESTLKLNYWDGENWQEDGITLVGHDEATNIIVFTLAHLTDFSLMAREPAMGLTKSVAGPHGGYLDLPLGAVVTYTLDLHNGGDGEATNLVLTDTLPAGVIFEAFVHDGGATYYEDATDVTVASGETVHVPAGTIVWSGSLASGAGEEIIFRALLPDDTAYLGQTVTNTAYYRGDNVVDGYDEAVVSFVPNTAPTVDAIADQVVGRDRTVGPLSFTIGDAETAPGDLVLTATSSNQDLFPDANLTLGGDGAQRAITLQPAAGATGTATITITVDDGHDATTVEFTVTVVHFGLFIPMSAGG